MSCKPLGEGTLDSQVLKADRKKTVRYDQCGVGEKAVYVPGKMSPRAFYIPFDHLERVFQRVAVSKGTGKAFLTPILYIVFVYDGGKEKEVYFKYLSDADKMLAKLEKEHPDLPLVSVDSEKKKEAAEALENEIKNAQLNAAAANAVRDLENASETLKMRPSLFKELAQAARVKRSMDLIDPRFEVLAIVILIAGLISTLAGVAYYLNTGDTVKSIWPVLIGLAAMFLMINSNILPTPKHSKKYGNKFYQTAITDMARSLKKVEDFPLPVRYSHPHVCDLMIRIIRTHRADTVEEALAVLKEDLKKMDSSVQLGGEEYRKVVTVKPLFTVCDYE